jgi:hypothetical protein
MDETQKVTIHSVKEPGEIAAELGKIGVLLAGLFTPVGDGWDVVVSADSARIGTLRTLGYLVTTESS